MPSVAVASAYLKFWIKVGIYAGYVVVLVFLQQNLVYLIAALGLMVGFFLGILEAFGVDVDSIPWGDIVTTFGPIFEYIKWFIWYLDLQPWALQMIQALMLIIPTCISIRIALAMMGLIFRFFGWIGRIWTLGAGGGK